MFGGSENGYSIYDFQMCDSFEMSGSLCGIAINLTKREFLLKQGQRMGRFDYRHVSVKIKGLEMETAELNKNMCVFCCKH